MTDKEKIEAMTLLLGINNNVSTPDHTKKLTAKEKYNETYKKLSKEVNDYEGYRVRKKNLC